MTISNTIQKNSEIFPFLQKINLPQDDSHKGQNGKLLIIGGSELFHAASKWSLDIASKFVDMVFYASVAENNELVSKALVSEAKEHFWNGIVISREHISEYIAEADAVLIGPGMERNEQTAQLTHELVSNYPQKKWVIDAGALQMIDPKMIPPTAILTPHQHEFDGLISRGFELELAVQKGIVVVLKGKVDQVYFTQIGQTQSQKSQSIQPLQVSGGNAGMTKGGTGDVLAGLIAGLYATNDAPTAALVGSFVNKRAGDELYTSVGPFFNASDLVSKVPEVLWKLLQELR